MKTRSITCILTAISMTAVHAATTSIFDDSFSGFNNGNLNSQGNWGSQAAFSVNNGNVIVNSSSGVFARAQRFGGFRPEVGDQVRITVSNFCNYWVFGYRQRGFSVWNCVIARKHGSADAPSICFCGA